MRGVGDAEGSGRSKGLLERIGVWLGCDALGYHFDTLVLGNVGRDGCKDNGAELTTMVQN
jgi:hypothetical protein